MPTFLSDPPQALYLTLAGLLVIFGLFAAQKQDKRTVSVFAGLFFLMLAVFLIDRFVESPREEAVRRTVMLAQAADVKSPDAFAIHFAPRVTITTAEGDKILTDSELRAHSFWKQIRDYNVSVSVKSFSRDDVKQIDDNNIEIGFMGHGTPQGMRSIPVYVRAIFTRQTDGAFKISGMRFYNAVDRNALFSIPGFP